MRRMLVATVVLGLGAVVAQAAIHGTGALLTEVTFKETITVASSGTVVDVYIIAQLTAGTEPNVGAVLLGIGNEPNTGLGKITPEHGPNPYQMWRQYEPEVWIKTVYQIDANSYLGTDPSGREADTHFLPKGPFWSPVINVPDEWNDGSIYIPPESGRMQGVGGLAVQSSVEAVQRAPYLVLAHVGVIRSGSVLTPEETVWGWSQSRDAQGKGNDYEFPIPEPATLTLLCLGTLALIRRRR